MENISGRKMAKAKLKAQYKYSKEMKSNYYEQLPKHQQSPESPDNPPHQDELHYSDDNEDLALSQEEASDQDLEMPDEDEDDQIPIGLTPIGFTPDGR